MHMVLRKSAHSVLAHMPLLGAERLVTLLLSTLNSVLTRECVTFMAAIPAATETVEDAKARAVRQAQLESDWAATVGEKGLGHGNARRKLSAAIIEDQQSYPKVPPQSKTKPAPKTPQKPVRRTAWGESPSDGQAEAPVSPAATPPKNPKGKAANTRSADEAERRRLKSLKKKAAQKRKKAMAKAAEVEAGLEGVSNKG